MWCARALFFLSVAAALLVPTHLAQADEARLALAKVVKKYDYSRFKDGPRRVPRARGASQRRAEALGIGDVEATKRLMRGRPSAALLKAAGQEQPAVSRHFSLQ